MILVARKAKKTEEELRSIFDAAGLTMVEPYDAEGSYPKDRYLLSECKTCHTTAHYRLEYLMKGAGGNTPVCRACKWREWYKTSGSDKKGLAGEYFAHLAMQAEGEGNTALARNLRAADPVDLARNLLRRSLAEGDDEAATLYRSILPPEPMSVSQAEKLAKDNGYDLVELIDDDKPGCEIMLVQCRACGRISAERPFDVKWGCSCRTHPNTPTLYASGESHLLRDSNEPCLGWWAHDLNDEDLFKSARTHARKEAVWRCPECGTTFKRKVFEMTGEGGPRCPECTAARAAQFESDVERYKKTPCSEVPELLEAWDDERSPSQIMVWHTGWSGMFPGDGQVRFKCKNGHHPSVFPYTYLTRGCPFCRAQGTAEDGGYIADVHPELAAEWCEGKNGHWTPSNVRPDSKRSIWWRCLACGNEWQDTPRARTKVRHACPECGKILGSLAWTFPSVAAEWDESNPLTPWQIRPRTTLKFKPKWVCKNDEKHRWQATLASRTNGGGCPQCSDSGKSRVELVHFAAAENVFGNARSGVKLDGASFSYPWTVDIMVSHARREIAIEYDGAYWHADKVGVDKTKSEELLAAGYIVVRLREDNLPSLDIPSTDYVELRVSSQTPRPSETMKELKERLESM